MRVICLIILLLFLTGCLQIQREEPEDCPPDYILKAGTCCVDLNKNNVCDTEEAFKEYQEFMHSNSTCRQPEIEDPRHPGFCCNDLDFNGKCDYLRDLV